MKIFQKLIRIVSAALFLLCFLETKIIFGQGKVDVHDYLNQRFHRYCELFPSEEIFVSSDREEYIAGEELWFNAWLIDKQSSGPSSDSKIIYLELLNPENKPISQKQIGIINGSGQGHIELPDTLTSGTYIIRAYTNWMKNCLPTHCFMKDLKIYNPFRSGFFKNKVFVEDYSFLNTLLDSNGQPACERFIYSLDKRENLLSIQMADSFRTRSNVSVELNMEDSRSVGLNSTNLCISVAPISNKNEITEPSKYMSFGSEFGSLPGRIIKDIKNNELPRELIDSLLLNIKSNWIDCRLILSDTLPEFKFKVEKENHFLSGILFTSDHQLAPEGELVLLSKPGKVAVFQYARTNKDAKFCFNIPIGEEAQELIIQPDDISKNYEIYLESPFFDKYPASEIRVDSIRKPMPSYLSKMGVNYQVGKIYGSTSVGTPFLTPFSSPITPKRFYGKPDEEIIMKDWVKLPSMEEVFFEIVPQVKLKKSGTTYEMLLVDPFGKILYDTPPVLMIDGVIVKDPGIIANLDPEKVEKIDVIKKRYMVGDYLFNGIVNVITGSGDLSNVAVPPYSIQLQYQVVDSVHTFKSPDYSSPEMKYNHEPDFRNTLYWNPSVRPGKDGKAKIEFWTSDITGDYEVKVQGISSDGKIFTTRKIFKVK